jgi:hypothetical protein
MPYNPANYAPLPVTFPLPKVPFGKISRMRTVTPQKAGNAQRHVAQGPLRPKPIFARLKRCLFELALAFVIWDSSLTVKGITLILQAVQQGDPTAAEELIPLVYDELRRLAAWRLANEVPGQTLQATALVHEAYLRLVGQQDTRWQGRGHFFGACAESWWKTPGAKNASSMKHPARKSTPRPPSPWSNCSW